MVMAVAARSTSERPGLVPSADPKGARPRWTFLVSLPTEPGSVDQAQDWTRHLLEAIGVPDVIQVRALLLVSELASGTVRDTAGPRFSLRLILGSGLEAAVHRQDWVLPRPRPVLLEGSLRRRPSLVEALADAWGSRHTQTGRWVWARLDQIQPGRRPLPAAAAG